MDKEVPAAADCSSELGPMAPSSSDSIQQVKAALEPIDEESLRWLYVRVLARIEKLRRAGSASCQTVDALSQMLQLGSVETLRHKYPVTATNFVVLACKNNQVEILNLLLHSDCPADPNDVDEDGFTAFFYVLQWNNLEMLKCLLTKWPMWPFVGTIALPDSNPSIHSVCAALRLSNVAGLSGEVRSFLEDELEVRYFLHRLSKLVDSTLNSDGANVLRGEILDAVVGALEIFKNYSKKFFIEKGLCHHELCLFLFSLVAENYQKLLILRKTISRKVFKGIEVPLTRILMPLMEYRRFGVLDEQLRNLKLQLLDDRFVYSMPWNEFKRHLEEMAEIQEWFRSNQFGVMEQQSLDHLLAMFLDLKSVLALHSGKEKKGTSNDPTFGVYQLTKDILALDSILQYTDLALSVEVRHETLLAKVVVERALQVMGEYCKDTEDVAHLSAQRQDRLSKVGLPIDRVTRLRDLLSHCSAAFAFTRTGCDAVDEYPYDLLEKVQQDLLKIKTLILKLLKQMELARVKLMISEMEFLKPFQALAANQKCQFAKLQACVSVKEQKTLLLEMAKAVKGDSGFQEIAGAIDNVLFAIRFREMSERIRKQEVGTRSSLKTFLCQIARMGQGQTKEGLTSHGWKSVLEMDVKSSITSIPYPQGIEDFFKSVTRRKARDHSSTMDREQVTLYDVVAQEIMEGVWTDENFKKMSKRMKFGFNSGMDLQSLKSKLVPSASEVINRIDLMITLEGLRRASPVKLHGDLELIAGEVYSVDDQTLERHIQQLLQVDDEHIRLFLKMFRTACATVESDRATYELVNRILQNVVDSAKEFLEPDAYNCLIEEMEQQRQVHKIKRTLNVLCDSVRDLPEKEFSKLTACLATSGAAFTAEKWKPCYGSRRKCKDMVQRLKSPFALVWNAISKEMWFYETCKSFQGYIESLKVAIPSICDAFLNQAFQEELLQHFDRYFYDTLEVLELVLQRTSNADLDLTCTDRLLHLCESDMKLRASVEMLVLKLIGILKEVAQPNTFWRLEVLLNQSLKRLLSKCTVTSGCHVPIRNYLAHGDAIAELLNPGMSSAVVLTALILVKNGRALVAVRRMLESLEGRTILKRVLCEEDLSSGPQLPTKYASCIQAILESDYSRQRLWKDDLLNVLQEKPGKTVADRFECGFAFLQRVAELEMVSAVCLNNLKTLKFYLDRGTSVVHWTSSKRWSLLHYAADKGSLEATEFLLKKGARPNATCNGGYTPLHLAIFNGHAEVIRVLLEHGADIDAVNGSGYTAVHFAALIGHCSLVEVLRKNGATVKPLTKYLQTPMHLAAWNGHADIVDVLLNAGAEADVEDAGHLTPLFYAAVEGHADVARLLLQKGSSPDGSEIKPVSPMHVACAKGHLEIVRLLIAAKADVNCRSAEMATPLQFACCCRRYDVLELLLVSGADVNGSTQTGLQTVLHYAAALGDTRAAKVLLEHGADIQAIDDHGLTALHFVASFGHVHLARMLLERKANVNAASKCDAVTPLHLAVDQGHCATVELLLQNGAAVDGTFFKEATGQSEYWALQVAAHKGHLEIVRTLLKHGADVNKVDETWMTALHNAACYGHADVVLLLLDSGALVDAASRSGLTTLHWAVIGGHCQIVETLLQKGADVTALSNEQLSVLHFAVEYGLADVVQLLLDHGACHCGDAVGAFPLHLAVINGNLEVLQVLLRNGIDVDTCAPLSETGLHLACKLTNLQDVASNWFEDPRGGLPPPDKLATIRYLISKGANVNACNVFWRTPLHHAAEKGDAEVVQILLEHGADTSATDRFNETALQLATTAHHGDCCRLLQTGLPENKPAITGNDQGSSEARTGNVAPVPTDERANSLCDAVKHGNVSMVKLLVASVSDAGIVANKNGLLHVAAVNGDLDIVRELLKVGARIDAVDAEGLTPLHAAAVIGHISMVQLLLDSCGVDVDVPSSGQHRTAVHFAADHNDSDLLALLVDRGAQLDVMDCDGATPLFLSARKGFVGFVKTLIKSGASVGAGVAGMDTPIHAAVSGGHVQMTRLLLSRSKGDVNRRGNDGRSPLHCCAVVGNLEMAVVLLARAADLNATDDSGRTPLHVAAKNGHADMVGFLLRSGASVDGTAKEVETPLHWAAEEGHGAVVALLLEHGANVNALNVLEETPLHKAIPSGYFGIAGDLIQSGADVNATDRNGVVPLMLASGEGHMDIVNVLLSNQARVDLVSNEGWAPIHLAMLNVDVAILEILLEHGANVDFRGRDGQTPLHLAATKGFGSHVEILLRNGARVDLVDSLGKTALHLACESDFCNVVRSLVQGGATVNAFTGDGIAPLVLAVKGGHPDVVLELLNNGATVNTIDDQNLTALNVAIAVNGLPLGEILLENGADANLRLSRGQSYLHFAATLGVHSLIPTLLKQGLDVNVLMEHSITPLIAAACQGHVSVLEVLLENGADIDAHNADGLTALQEAVANQRLEAMQFLLEHGGLCSPNHGRALLLHYAAKVSDSPAILGGLVKHGVEVNAVDSDGQTPLHVASKRGSVAAVRALVESGASVDAADHSGKTPLCWAASEGHLEVVRKLLEAGAKVDSCDNDLLGTPLHWVAAHSGHLDVAIELLRRNANVNALDASRNTPLLLAARNQHRELMQRLIQDGAEVNARNVNGDTALFEAVVHGDLGVVRLLIENGADATMVNESNHNALQQGIVHGHTELTRYFLGKGFDLEVPLENGATLLHIAVCAGRAEVARILLDHGLSMNATTVEGHHTPLHLAATLGYLDVMRLLLDRGADRGATDCLGMTALHHAVLESHRSNPPLEGVPEESCHLSSVPERERQETYVRIVELLIGSGIAVDVMDDAKRSPIHLAAYNGHSNIVGLLLDSGADIASGDEELLTPLHYAAMSGHADTVTVLMDRGATVDARTINGSTPLCLASGNGHPEVVESLLDRGASVMARNDHDTMLHASVSGGSAEVVRLILDRLKQIDPDIQKHLDAPDDDGDTPLMWAAQGGKAAIAEMLLLEGSSVGARNQDNATALNWALQNGHADVVEMLLRFGAIWDNGED